MNGLAEPRANPLLLGQADAEHAMMAALAAGRMHHAWLITGKPGIGKATLAYRFARWRFAGAPKSGMARDPSDPVFRRVATGTHADLLTVEREWDPKRRRLRSEIVVDDVRAVGHFLRLTPAEGGWRVVVIDGAEEMNRNSANALLKILEEPPKLAILLLVCAAPGRLPATLRSRCRQLMLAPLPTAVVSTLLQTAWPDGSATERERIAALAEGSVGRALELAEGDAVAIADLVQDVLDKIPNVSVLRAHEVADQLGRSETAFATFMELTRAFIATALGNAVRGRLEPRQTRLIAQRSLAEWAEIWETLGRMQDETERFYLDKRQAIVSGIALMSRT